MGKIPADGKSPESGETDIAPPFGINSRREDFAEDSETTDASQSPEPQGYPSAKEESDEPDPLDWRPGMT